MAALIKQIKGDRLIWAITALLAIVSLLVAYSTGSNLVRSKGNLNVLSFLFKHLAHLTFGFALMFFLSRVKHKYFRNLSKLMVPVVIVLLFFTLLQGRVVEGANASRWIYIPIVGASFQTSSLAIVVLMSYLAHYLAENYGNYPSFKSFWLFMWLPVFLVIGLILPANLSTALIFFTMVIAFIFLGGYPIKYIGVMLATAVLSFAFFVLTIKAFPTLMSNRVDTWSSRADQFLGLVESPENYQVKHAKMAIASVGLRGLGPGKSIQKNILPQASSDYIYAIIVEEYGFIGGVIVMLLYLWLLFRVLIIAQKAATIYGKLLVIGAGLPIVFQALVNMGVAVGVLPATGQTLPLISSGGTSIWTTCLSLGLILSVSTKRQQIDIGKG